MIVIIDILNPENEDVKLDDDENLISRESKNGDLNAKIDKSKIIQKQVIGIDGTIIPW